MWKNMEEILDDERAPFERNRIVNHMLSSPNAGHLLRCAVLCFITYPPRSISQRMRDRFPYGDRRMLRWSIVADVYHSFRDVVCLFSAPLSHSWKQQQSPQPLTDSIWLNSHDKLCYQCVQQWGCFHREDPLIARRDITSKRPCLPGLLPYAPETQDLWPFKLMTVEKCIHYNCKYVYL